MRYKVNAKPHLNIRSKPNGTKIGRAIDGSILNVSKIVDNWAELAVYHNGKVLLSPAFVNASFLTLLDQPSISSVNIGLNVLANGGMAMSEAQKGCKFFMIMDDFLAAHQVKSSFSNCTVMVRKYLPSKLYPDDLIRAMQVYPESRLVYTGHNEQDIIGTSVEGIKERFDFDVEVATRIKQIAPKAKYAAGTWSMGEPDVTSPKIQEVLRATYAVKFNEGLFGIDQHSYSHKKVLNDSEAHWLVRRWEMYFQSCGFNPERKKSIYMGETGCDDWGKGFTGQESTQEEFRAWCNRFMEIGSKPLVVNGVKYESPLVGGAIFQLGGNGDPRWNKFDVAGYLDTLKGFYG